MELRPADMGTRSRPEERRLVGPQFWWVKFQVGSYTRFWRLPWEEEGCEMAELKENNARDRGTKTRKCLQDSKWAWKPWHWSRLQDEKAWNWALAAFCTLDLWTVFASKHPFTRHLQPAKPTTNGLSNASISHLLHTDSCHCYLVWHLVAS